MELGKKEWNGGDGERENLNEILTERSHEKMAGLSGNKENPFGFRDDRFKLKTDR